MGGVFDEFRKEERRKMLILGAMVIKMQSAGKGIEEIAKITDLPLDEIKELTNLYEDNKKSMHPEP